MNQTNDCTDTRFDARQDGGEQILEPTDIDRLAEFCQTDGLEAYLQFGQRIPSLLRRLAHLERCLEYDRLAHPGVPATGTLGVRRTPVASFPVVSEESEAAERALDMLESSNGRY